MVCRNQELFTNNCNHGNERLFHINVCDANRKTVENIATRQSICHETDLFENQMSLVPLPLDPLSLALVPLSFVRCCS